MNARDAGMNFDKVPYKLFRGDCIEVMKTLPANSIDALVTDPPYGWRFMGEAWDGADIVKHATKTGKGAHKIEDEWYIASDGRRRRRVRGGLDTDNMSSGSYDLSKNGNYEFQKWTEEWAREALRILKPGAHALIFCGPRTYHRMATGVEDAGFEIRDQLQWIFGSGFPKSLDISKGIDKCFGGKREKTGEKTKARTKNGKSALPTLGEEVEYKTWDIKDNPATSAAAAWKGWGTALKPANEPIVLARKPLEKKTVAKNVLKYGTGGINVDAGRIGFDAAAAAAAEKKGVLHLQHKKEGSVRIGGANPGDTIAMYKPGGRFPSNVIFDEWAAKMLDEQVAGKLHAAGNSKVAKMNTSIWKSGKGFEANLNKNDFDGGASRFFFVCSGNETTELLKHSCESTSARSVASFFRTILQTEENIVLSSAGEKDGKQLARNVRCAGIQCGICVTLIAQDIVKMRTLNSGKALKLIREFMPDFESYTPIQNLVSHVESLVNIATIPTTADFLVLCGYVQLAIEESIKLESLNVGSGQESVTRFRYIAKTSKNERNAGCEEIPQERSGAYGDFAGDGRGRQTEHASSNNTHPTVKPFKLMRYLINLITPPGGIVLEPFLGSGTTGAVAVACGFKFIGIEREEKYFEIATARIKDVKLDKVVNAGKKQE